MKKIFSSYCELPRWIRKPLWKAWHKYLAKKDKHALTIFMNYGYAGLNGEGKTVDLADGDEPNRFSIQLYHHVASGTELKGRDVLEVGCGRGGGASYIMGYFAPNLYVGLDQSKSGTAFCNRYFKMSGLSFVRGYAENLPFKEGSFDCVINIESSRCYGDMNAFLSGVWKVLRPGGNFLLADLRTGEGKEELKAQLQAAGFKTLKEEKITQNVIRSLELDDARRKKLIEENVPGYLKNSFWEWAGVRGSDRYYSFINGDMDYWNFILQKA
ncbi:MAG: class I SAM-dependent methyltransferase [Spirochaetes bacterium]|nr:MAG: class I SAM-dependent methyltransferase [Spirochaetota bacterium]